MRFPLVRLTPERHPGRLVGSADSAPHPAAPLAAPLPNARAAARLRPARACLAAGARQLHRASRSIALVALWLASSVTHAQPPGDDATETAPAEAPARNDALADTDPPAAEAPRPSAEEAEEAAAADTDAPEEAAEADTDDFDDLDPDDEVTVYSEWLVEQARQDVIAAAAEAGYRRKIRKDDRTILRHDAPYAGEIVLKDDGSVRIKRQPIQFRPPSRKDKPPPHAWLACLLPPLCIRPSGQTVSQRRFAASERRAMAAIKPELRVYDQRIADYGIDRKLNDLPDALYALWERGEPLSDNKPPIDTHAARREALFDYWDTRTDTPWGMQIRGAVQDFIDAVVQRSEHPFTRPELDALNHNRRSARALQLEVLPDATP